MERRTEFGVLVSGTVLRECASREEAYASAREESSIVVRREVTEWTPDAAAGRKGEYTVFLFAGSGLVIQEDIRRLDEWLPEDVDDIVIQEKIPGTRLWEFLETEFGTDTILRVPDMLSYIRGREPPSSSSDHAR